MSFKVDVLTNRFFAISAEMPAKVDLVVETIAQDVRTDAEQSSPDYAGIKQGWIVNRAAGGGRGGVFRRLVSNREWRAVFAEDGTPYLAAQPMLRPALERNRLKFESALAKLLFNGR